jgi:hypothetical protein
VRAARFLKFYDEPLDFRPCGALSGHVLVRSGRQTVHKLIVS